MFGKNQSVSFEVSGSTNQYGAKGNFVFNQANSGEYLRVTKGPLSWTQGFDGNVAWEKDWSGSTRLLDYSDRDRTHLINLIQFGGWLTGPNQLIATINQEKSDAGQIALELRFPGCMGPAMLWIDRQSFLPRTMVLASTMQPEQISFMSYKKFGDLNLPSRIEVRAGDVIHVEEVTSVKEPDQLPDFAPLATDMSGVVFSGETTQLKIKRAPTGHVLVNLSLNNQEPVWFVFDTGAGGTVVDERIVRKLRLQSLGNIQVMSVLGLHPASIVELQNVQLAAVRLERVFGLEFDLSPFDGALGEEVGGIIGYDLLSKCVAEITLESDTIQILDPLATKLPETAWLPIHLDRRLPMFPARLNEMPEELFRIDVGAAGEFFGNVVFHKPYTDQHELDAKFGKTPFPMPPHDFSVGEVSRFELNGHVFAGARAGFALADIAPFNDFYCKGNIGVEFLKPFTIILDYPHHRYSIRKNQE
jgi:hypothetical protein